MNLFANSVNPYLLTYTYLPVCVGLGFGLDLEIFGNKKGKMKCEDKCEY